MNLTTKQVIFMTVVCSGSKVTGEEWNDLDQILERLSVEHDWTTSKDSIQFTIRALLKHGMIEKGEREKRRGRLRAIIKPTTLGLQSFASPQRVITTAENSLSGLDNHS